MSKFDSLKRYRYQPKDSSGKKNGLGARPDSSSEVSRISQTPESSPVIVSKKRSAVVVIDSDSEEEPSLKRQKSESPWLTSFNRSPTGSSQVSSSSQWSPRQSSCSSGQGSSSQSFSSQGSWCPSSSSQGISSSVPSSQESTSWDSPQPIPDYQGMTAALHITFPAWPKWRLKDILISVNGDYNKAAKIITSKNIAQEIERSKGQMAHNDSISSQDSAVGVPVRKRVRQLTDSSEEGSQDATGLSFLTQAFPNTSPQKLSQVLTANQGNVSKASEVLTAQMSGAGVSPVAAGSIKDIQANRQVNKNHQKHHSAAAELPSDEEEEEDYTDSEDEFSQDDKMSSSPLMLFFNEAPVNELMSMPGCSKKKAELLISTRPFDSWEDLANKLHANKLTSLITGCREMMTMRKVVDTLMQKCEGIAERMGNVITQLTGSTTLSDVDNDRHYLRKQPAGLNDRMSLKPYQMVGLNWLMLMHQQELNGILADEMGLGKTIQTIAFLTQLLEEGDKGPHVIIAPSSTLDNWLRELRVWSADMKVLLYYGSQEDRRDIRDQVMDGTMDEFHVILTTYNMATGSVEDRALFKKGYFSYAVFDEGHMLKNMSSLRYQNLMKIRADRRLLLTGTPLQNNLIELMSLLAFVMPHFFTGKTDHLKQMFTTITNLGNKEDRGAYEKATVVRAKKIMKPFFLRRLKTEVLKQLPQKLAYVEHIPMTTEQEALYEELRSQFQRRVTEQGMTTQKAQMGSAMLMDLRKAANHPLLHRRHYTPEKLRIMAKLMLKEPTHSNADPQLIFEDMEVMSDFELNNLCLQYPSLCGHTLARDLVSKTGKFQWLDEQLPKFKEQGDRVLLFSQFTMVLDIIEHYMKSRKHKYLRLDGSTQVSERQCLIDEYTNSPDIFVFLLSTRAGGLGINLTAANTVILHDIDFNPYNDKQAEDRCHRLGQTKNVSVYRLISKSSIEEGMHRCAENKLQLEADVTGAKRGKGKSEDEEDVVTLLRHALKSTS